MVPYGALPNNAKAQHEFTISGSVENLYANSATAEASVTASAAQSFYYHKALSNNIRVGFYNPVPTGETEYQYNEPITYHPLSNTYTANVDIGFYLKTEAKAMRANLGGSATASSVASSITTNSLALYDYP